MAYLPQYDHDVFVSYAHLDNEPEVSGDGGWVDVLVKHLEGEIRKRLGTRDLRIWVDRDLATNRPLSTELLTRVRRSGLLLVIMSPSYVNSEWCRRERETFLALVKDRVAEGSVFLAHARCVPQKKIPPEFAELLGDRFWVDDAGSGTDRPLGGPDGREPQFISQIYRLSQKIKEQLDRLRTAASMAGPRPVDPLFSRGSTANGQALGIAKGQPLATGAQAASPVSVFVARSTDDLEGRESDLRSYLRQAGVEVLPRSLYPIADPSAYEAAMREDLGRCKLYVELLGPSRGHELAGGLRLPALQHEIAANVGKPVLSWRDRALDMGSIGDADHRKVLDGACACGIEEFMRTVAEEARREAPKPRPVTAGAMVFVNADATDRALARQVGHALQGWGVECYWPLEQGTPDVVRQDLEENLRQCDGVVLVYGRTGAEWVRHQLRLGRKVLALREQPLNALAIVEGPPPEKPDIGAAIPNMLTLNCRTGIDASALRSFADSLRPSS